MDKGTPIKYRYSRGLVALMSVIALAFIPVSYTHLTLPTSV